MPKWLKEVKDNKGDEVIIVVAGNKSDEAGKREVTMEEGKKFAAENKASFFEISAKTGNGVEVMFNEIATTILQTESPSGPDNAPGSKKYIGLIDSKFDFSRP